MRPSPIWCYSNILGRSRLIKKEPKKKREPKYTFFLFFLWIKWNEMERRFSVVLERYYIFLSLCHVWKSNRFRNGTLFINVYTKKFVNRMGNEGKNDENDLNNNKEQMVQAFALLRVSSSQFAPMPERIEFTGTPCIR